MKKFIPIIALAGLSFTASAQTEFEALKFSQTDIVGTARFMSMGGAFGALGGDASSININPAGTGVYRHLDMGLSFGLTDNYTTTDWYGGTSDESRWRVPFNSFSFVFAMADNDKTHGIISSNLSFTFNKLKNFNRNTSAFAANDANTSITDYLAQYSNANSAFNPKDLSASTWDNLSLGFLTVGAYNTHLINPTPDSSSVESALNIGELVNPQYNIHEEGYINEWNISYGMNISNRFFWGIGLGIQDLKYRKEVYYQEKFGAGGSMMLESSSETTGTGFNFNAGVIGVPVDFLRIGAAVHSPTLYHSSDEQSGLTSDQDMRITGITDQTRTATPGRFQSTYFELNTPWRYDFSLAFILGHYGALSLDYELTDYNTMRLNDDKGMSSFYNTENNNIKNIFKATHSLRAGLEVQVAKGVFARCGYAFVTSPFDNPKNASKQLAYNTVDSDPSFMITRWTNYFSGGIGYRNSNFYVDMAYQLRHEQYDLYTYDFKYATTASLEPIKAKNFMHNIVLTGGIRF